MYPVGLAQVLYFSSALFGTSSRSYLCASVVFVQLRHVALLSQVEKVEFLDIRLPVDWL